MEECYTCSCWDSEREGCTIPSVDLIYACPLYAEKEEEEEESS